METLVEAHLAEQLLTYAEYRELEVDDNLWYELLNGELVKKSSPSPLHQIAQANLFWLMENQSRINKLGKILCAPLIVYVDDYNVPQPDLFFYFQRQVCTLSRATASWAHPTLWSRFFRRGLFATTEALSKDTTSA